MGALRLQNSQNMSLLYTLPGYGGVAVAGSRINRLVNPAISPKPCKIGVFSCLLIVTCQAIGFKSLKNKAKT